MEHFEYQPDPMVCSRKIEIELEDGKRGYIYGGDSGEFPHDGNFCCDKWRQDGFRRKLL